MLSENIPAKANRVLHFIILGFLLIAVRIWFLCVIEHDHYVELSKKPQRKTIIEKPLRGTIRDRFNIPLAVNKLRYDAAICYEQIRHIPSVARVSSGKKNSVKIYPRKEYITRLSQLLGYKLGLDPLDIEDMIYSKAALFPNTPFTLKEDLPEKLYYELKGLERDYAGLCMLKSSKREYPLGKVGSDLLGYIGSVNEEEYFSISHEIRFLQEHLDRYQKDCLTFLPKGFNSLQEIKDRLSFLRKKAYNLNEQIGKAGIEVKCNDLLKGRYGKTLYEVNTKGSIVRKLPGSKEAVSGNRILLNISSELQEFAEALLAENELIREARFPSAAKNHHLLSPPWMKGGAIVAMIPQTGEIVALASYPRSNSNDFVTASASSVSRIPQWLEQKSYIGDIWDGKRPLERELYSHKQHDFYQETKNLSLDRYLERILSLHSPVKRALQKITSLGLAIELQNALAFLLDVSEQPYVYALVDTLYSEKHKPTVFATNPAQIATILAALQHHEFLVKEKKIFLDKILFDIPDNNDKLLLLDIIKMLVCGKTFSPELLKHVEKDSLSIYRKLCQSLAVTTDLVRKLAKEHFHTHDFRQWRTDHFKSYLAQKRLEEKEQKKHQKPYIDYLKALETEQFEAFWLKYKWDLIALFLHIPYTDTPSALLSYQEHFTHSYNSLSDHPTTQSINFLISRLHHLDTSMHIPYLQTMRSYHELKEKLYGYYSQIKKKKGSQLEQDLAGAFYPPGGYGYGRSYGFRQATPLGSIFKIITAYEALKQNYERGVYHHTKDLNPLTIIDEIQPSSKKEGLILGLHEDGRKIPRRYKGGTLPRTHTNLGKVDYIKAFERSSNVYFSLLASDVIQEPNDLVLASLKFGFGNKTGIDLPGEIPGALPKDLYQNRSGLYAFAIGQHSLIVTPLQTAVMLSSLVNHGKVLKPQILQLTAGKTEDFSSPSLEETYDYQEYLHRIGIFFPFFLHVHSPKTKYNIKLFEPTLYRQLFLPANIKEYLLEGMHSVISSPRGAARAEMIRYLYQNTKAMRNYLKLKYQLAGKTSSAEIAYHPTLDRHCPPILCQDIWFGGVSFKNTTTSSSLPKKHEEIPELVVVVYLKFGDFGKEAAPLAGEIITKWREICQKHGCSSYLESIRK